MLVIPAIDLKNGRCVRLTEGREESAKVYDRDPLEVAHAYERAGASLIHIVDLDGAFSGTASPNRKVIRQINSEINIPTEVGGGIRSLADIESVLDGAGAQYAIVGTMAVEQPDTFAQAVKQFADRVVAGIDARGDRVATRGWVEQARVSALSLARKVADLGVRRIIYTDIARDGRLGGPNIEMTREIARQSGASVTASGGVATLDDIARLMELESDGVDSVIIGKALYERRFTLEEALAATFGSG